MMSSVSSILLQPAEFPTAYNFNRAPLKLLEVNHAESAQSWARTFGQAQAELDSQPDGGEGHEAAQMVESP